MNGISAVMLRIEMTRVFFSREEECSLKASAETESQQERHYVYMVRCADNSLYTGWTNRLQERILAHNAGRGAKYTKSRRPVTLCYCEEFDSKPAALKRECEIKKLKRKQKEILINDC